MSSEPGALAKVHFQALKPTGQENTPLLLSPSHLQTSPYLWCVLNTAKGLWVVCICSLYGPGEDAAASHTAAAGMGIWVLGGGAGVLSFVHLLSLTKNCLSSRHVPHVQVRSSSLNTLISLDGMWRSCFFLSFGITCSEEGLHVQEGGSILLAVRRHLFFLCDSQSEGPQGADFQLPSNSCTFTPALLLPPLTTWGREVLAF